ncbi:hypothetical protein F5Y17DRAFT_8866 [Xylariaceae sp. FL0594]|nr:hypothetical protein F5Y17DRAFT_8866 [Xylariaceae sp. FL0594]
MNAFISLPLSLSFFPFFVYTDHQLKPNSAEIPNLLPAYVCSYLHRLQGKNLHGTTYRDTMVKVIYHEISMYGRVPTCACLEGWCNLAKTRYAQDIRINDSTYPT